MSCYAENGCLSSSISPGGGPSSCVERWNLVTYQATYSRTEKLSNTNVLERITALKKIISSVDSKQSRFEHKYMSLPRHRCIGGAPVSHQLGTWFLGCHNIVGADDFYLCFTTHILPSPMLRPTLPLLHPSVTTQSTSQGILLKTLHNITHSPHTRTRVGLARRPTSLRLGACHNCVGSPLLSTREYRQRLRVGGTANEFAAARVTWAPRQRMAADIGHGALAARDCLRVETGVMTPRVLIATRQRRTM